ncbi:MAG: YbhB/YbcL family Raf kinase inhibitor-like protein [Pseudobdellovibrionaceae bacterium]
MQKTTILSSLLIIGASAMLCSPLAHAANLKLSSPTLQNGAVMDMSQVYDGLGCTGGNTSPEISWKDIPDGTKSFAVTVYDPDAPTGSGWWHWMVVNIPADARGLPAGAGSADGKKLPTGAIQITTDFGKPGYNGACPPADHKNHRYEFTVYALKDVIPVDPKATAAAIGFYINSLKLSSAQIIVLYKR